MLPVTLLPEETLVDTSFSYLMKRRSRQPAPFNVPARYYLAEAGLTWWTGNPVLHAAQSVSQGYARNVRAFDPVAVNRVYEKFVKKIHDPVSMGVLLAERREASDSILKRVGTLRKAWSELRRGRFRNFLKVLDVPPLEKHRGVVRVRGKQASAYWLEYWFGWSPLISDVYKAVELLDSDYPSLAVSVVSGNSRHVKEGDLARWDERTVCKIQADVSVSNEMLYRANQYGVINPALIAWELVPFSFLVDWFIPVGNYLRSYTDFVGLSVRNVSAAYLVRGDMEYGWNLNRGGYPVTSKSVFTAFSRLTSLPGPSITAAIPTRLSNTRAATAISLLVQLFINDRK